MKEDADVVPGTEEKTETVDQQNPAMVTENFRGNDERAPPMVTEESGSNDDHDPEIVTWPQELSELND